MNAYDLNGLEPNDAGKGEKPAFPKMSPAKGMMAGFMMFVGGGMIVASKSPAQSAIGVVVFAGGACLVYSDIKDSGENLGQIRENYQRMIDEARGK